MKETRRREAYVKLTPDGSISIDYESLLNENDVVFIAKQIIKASYSTFDYFKKDAIDRFLDFVYAKVQNGHYDIISTAFPCKRMNDKELEAKIIELINEHLHFDIVLKLLKFFTLNLYDSDSNLYIANLIYSKDIIQSLYNTFILLKNDIFITDVNRRTLNVKRIQQLSPFSDDKFSSPLDAVARMKYILQFFSL
jgi:hypothetical protein